MKLKNKAVAELLREYLKYTQDPYLNSMDALPHNVLDKLLTQVVKEAEIDFDDECLKINIPVSNMRRRVISAFKRDIIHDDIGLLILYGASKHIITEITGAHVRTIIKRRKVLNCEKPVIGRPRILSPEELDLVIDMWSRIEGSTALKLIRITAHTGFNISDVWSVVKKIKALPCRARNRTVYEDVRQYG